MFYFYFIWSVCWLIYIYLCIFISRLLTESLAVVCRTLVEDHCCRQWNSIAWPKSKVIHIAPCHVLFPSCTVIRAYSLCALNTCFVPSSSLSFPCKNDCSFRLTLWLTKLDNEAWPLLCTSGALGLLFRSWCVTPFRVTKGVIPKRPGNYVQCAFFYEMYTSIHQPY